MFLRHGQCHKGRWKQRRTTWKFALTLQDKVTDSKGGTAAVTMARFNPTIRDNAANHMGTPSCQNAGRRPFAQHSRSVSANPSGCKQVHSGRAGAFTIADTRRDVSSSIKSNAMYLAFGLWT